MGKAKGAKVIYKKNKPVTCDVVFRISVIPEEDCNEEGLLQYAEKAAGEQEDLMTFFHGFKAKTDDPKNHGY